MGSTTMLTQELTDNEVCCHNIYVCTCTVPICTYIRTYMYMYFQTPTQETYFAFTFDALKDLLRNHFP